jgi:LemA protein
VVLFFKKIIGKIKHMNTTQIAILIVAIIVVWAVFTYNRLVALRNRAKEAFSDIDVQLKRRYNLIPNLLEAVKGYAAHEKGVFEAVTKARANALLTEQSGNIKNIAGAENMLTGALKSLFAVAENYPDLKASSNFMELQRELRDTEDKIQASRRFFNTTVMTLNTMIQGFPMVLVAKTLGFKQEEFFEIEEEEKAVPKVSF